MTRPEEALAAARRAAAIHAERYADVPPTRFGPPRERIALRLSEWAVPDPQRWRVGSIRSYGLPITLLKRGLVRLLAQYHHQLVADQSRYNVLLLGYVRGLEERIAQLERALAEAVGVEEPDAAEDDWA